MKVLIFTALSGLFLFTVSFRANQQPKPWPVPEKQLKKRIRLNHLPNLFRQVRLYGTSIVHPVMVKQERETEPKRPN